MTLDITGVLTLAENKKVRFIQLEFMDIRGVVKTVSIPVSQLATAMEGQAEVDFFSAFTDPLPVAVISELLGVGIEDRDEFIRKWIEAFERAVVKNQRQGNANELLEIASGTGGLGGNPINPDPQLPMFVDDSGVS